MVKILLYVRQMATAYIIILLLGFYLVGLSIYNVVYSASRGELIANGIGVIIGGILVGMAGSKLLTKEKKAEGKGQPQGQQGQRPS